MWCCLLQTVKGGLIWRSPFYSTGYNLHSLAELQNRTYLCGVLLTSETPVLMYPQKRDNCVKVLDSRAVNPEHQKEPLQNLS